MNKKTRKKIKKYIKKKNINNTIKKKYNKTNKKYKNLQSGGLFTSKICKKKQIQKKYKIVFVKNLIGGAKGMEIYPPSCKKKISDLELQHKKYIEEWKKL